MTVSGSFVTKIEKEYAIYHKKSQHACSYFSIALPTDRQEIFTKKSAAYPTYRQTGGQTCIVKYRVTSLLRIVYIC